MGRLAGTTLDALRAIPIKDVAERLGIELGNGRQNARCFNEQAHKHGDRNRSLGLDERVNLFKCFGCGIAGDTIKLVELVEGKGFRGACEYLSQTHGVKLDTEITERPNGGKPTPNFTRKSPYADYNDPIRLDDNYNYSLPYAEIYQEFYANTEPPSNDLKKWWSKRGLSDELLTAYGWRTVTPATYAKTLKRYSEQDLTQSGLITATNGQKRHIFSGAYGIATPYFDDELFNGKKVLYLRARTLNPTLNAKYLAPSGTSPIIYGFDRLYKWVTSYPDTLPLFITESETDSIAITELARQQGKEVYAIALVGGQKTENSLTVRELTHIVGGFDKSVVVNIVTDRDKTGDVFYNAVATALYKQGLNPKNLIKWQEWHESIKDVGEHLQKLTEQANSRTVKPDNNAKELEQ